MNKDYILKASEEYNDVVNSEFDITILFCLDVKSVEEFEKFENSVIESYPEYHNLDDYSSMDYYDRLKDNGFENYNGEELVFLSDYSISMGLEEDFLKIFDKDISKGRKRILAFGTQFKTKEELFEFLLEHIDEFNNEPLYELFEYVLYYEQ